MSKRYARLRSEANGWLLVPGPILVRCAVLGLLVSWAGDLSQMMAQDATPEAPAEKTEESKPGDNAPPADEPEDTLQEVAKADDAGSAEDLSAKADWQPLSLDQAIDRVQRMLEALPAALLKNATPKDTSAKESVVETMKQLWAASPDRLSLELDTLRSSYPALADLIEQVRKSPDHGDAAALKDLPRELQADIQVWIGRELARQRLYDEALKWLGEIQVNQTVDPATLLFFRAICRHSLWEQPELALKDVKQLLRREQELPARYRLTAKLMQADLTPKEQPNPLDEVSRLMSDVGRRLDLGRAGDSEVKRETEIIDKLDKMIEDLEKQLQQRQQQQQAASGDMKNQGKAQPMQDSQIAGGSGPGDVDQKDLGAKRGWGDLPPAEREEALQKMIPELPSNYREVIEGYFRKLATEPKAP